MMLLFLKKLAHLVSIDAFVPGLIQESLKVELVKETSVRLRSTENKSIDTDHISHFVQMSQSHALTFLTRR